MPPLDGLTLWVPDLWNRREEWTEAIEEADEPEKEIIKVQARLSILLEGLENAEAEPLTLAIG